ncbi:hypothetical protein AOA81_01420 [Methanomassiliicoccales archaeon RumEn M2]|mgnify:FL=1|nr:hypothetical protein AOA81_01420 [Methanomassiliicoccales archaeon RumEn M2]
MIKMLVMDVDGTLTDGKIYMTSNGEECKAFDIKDGYGIRNILPNMGVIPVIITGRSSSIVKKRAEELNIKEVHQGIDDKLILLNEICTKHSISIKDVAYIGDDCNDIPSMRTVGLSFAPSDCSPEVRGIASYVMSSAGGRGAVRECIEYIKKINRGLQ